MAILTADELADIRADKADNYPDSIAIWRSPTSSGGKVGAMAQVATALGRLWPKTDARGLAPHLVIAVPEIAAARVDAFVTFPNTVDVRIGDELRIGGARYKVDGSGLWTTTRVCTLDEVRS